MEAWRIRNSLAAAIAATLAGSADGSPTSDVSFDRDIRPILSNNCFQCHGPDPSSRRADLRLDVRDAALKRAIVPGDAGASELIARITVGDPDDRMPPPETHKTLTADEIDLLRRWIDGGAQWQTHWSFLPWQRPDLPPVRDGDWPTNGIDRFILARLDAEGLAPAPPADRETWLRRVTLDLTGLPPTLQEIDAFLADGSPDAHETVVDRLLTSVRFGERMAVPWLDLARYADSYGYQSDQLSPTWPYRDWVVRALNNNLPYDAFIRQQLAGDLLPDADRGQRLATAFNRLHRMTNEGGSIEQEYRTEYAADRVRTFGTAFLGLTLECARCHDHKFDPITMREYYSLFAFFNNIDEWGMYHDSGRVPTPSLLLPTPEQEQTIAQHEARLREAEASVKQAERDREDVLRSWLEGADDARLSPGLVGHYTFDALGAGNALRNSADDANPGSTSPANQIVPGRDGGALQFTGDDPASFPKVGGALQPWEAYSIGFWIRRPAELTDALILHRSGGTDVGRFGTELTIRDGRLFFATIRFWPGNAMAIETIAELPVERWTHVALTYNASGSATGMRLYVDGHAAETRILRDNLTKSPGAPGHGITFGERFRDAGLAGGAIDDLYVFSRAIAPIEVLLLVDAAALTRALDARDEEALRDYYFAAVDEPVASARAARARAVHDLLRHVDGVTETMVMDEMQPARPAHVLARGAYDAPRTDANQVSRGVPGSLSPWPGDAPLNRLGLAQWVTDPANPLAARMAVNRLWQIFFGRGLILTSEDFGVQGARPSHPELLDWLAADFVESGWNVKRLCRQIVLSSTYGQASARSEGGRDRDPENILLSRGPARRLSAEMLRDLCLAAAGLLDETVGGPPVSPYQPPGLWRESNTMSPHYQQSVGTALYRRSLYTVWKRTAPMPNMIAFDAATREVCVARRSDTASPIQALVLLNDPQFVEAARVLGERMLREGGATTEEQVRFAFRVLTGRHSSEAEQDHLVAMFHEQRQIFAANPDQADELLSVGAHALDPELGAVDIAAAAVVAQAILNLDAAVWKR